MSRPVSAIMDRATSGLMPGDLGEPGDRVQHRGIRAGPGTGPVVPSVSTPQAAGIAAVVVEHAVQGLDEIIVRGLHAAPGQGSQRARVAFPGDHRLDHVLRGQGGQLAGHHR